jgi:hypothetical protein
MYVNFLTKIQDASIPKIAEIENSFDHQNLLEEIKAMVKTAEIDGYLVQLLVVMVILEHGVLFIKTIINKVIGEKP